MLTERIIRDAKPGLKPTIIWDRQVKGLGCKVAVSGTKTYILNYYVAGRERRVTLARCSEISLREARERAGRELAAIRAGETDPLERRREAKQAPTVNDGLDRFFDEFIPARIATGHMTETTARKYRNQAGNYLRPALGKRRVADVTRLDVENMVKPLARTPTLRNRVLAFTSRLFNLFEAWEWRPQHTNPARGVDRAREEARDRVLSPSELSDLGGALRELEQRHPAPVAAIRFAAVTGLRISEVLAIQQQHVKFETGRLLIPSTKTGRRWHDLPALAIAILRDVSSGENNSWAFSSNGAAPVGYKSARAVFAQAAKRAGLDDVRLHDLRRTVMTTAAAAGVGTHVLRDLLGHKTTAMADRYIRAVGSPVRDAREQVGATIASMMEGKVGEVVPMRRRDG